MKKMTLGSLLAAVVATGAAANTALADVTPAPAAAVFSDALFQSLAWTTPNPGNEMPSLVTITGKRQELPRELRNDSGLSHMPYTLVKFSAPGTYVATLPDVSRSGNVAVSIQFTGGPAASAADGTIVTLDGATMGLQLDPPSALHPLCQLFVLTQSSAGEATWVKTNMHFPVYLGQADKTLATTGALNVVFNYPSKTWDLYAPGFDKAIARGITLFADPMTSPTLSITPGTVGGTTYLRRLVIGNSIMAVTSLSGIKKI